MSRVVVSGWVVGSGSTHVVVIFQNKHRNSFSLYLAIHINHNKITRNPERWQIPRRETEIV